MQKIGINVLLVVAVFFLLTSVVGAAPDIKTPMNNARLEKLISKIDKSFDGRPGYWKLVVESRLVLVITDERADRMRILTSVVKVDELENKELMRLLQANFDSALDARYAVAKGVLWSAFIHPLSPLQDRQFLDSLGQVVNLADTFGTHYSSGSLVFQGGDSSQLQRRKLIDSLIEKGLAI